tara:strand:+ start:257 stop:571 length:315 start_codon:yes stop_codon:yes gene_type:complete
MKKKNGDNDNVVNLEQFRKEKSALNIRVGGYYANLELGVYLHIVGVTSPMHTKNAECHFIAEDHFGNLVTFRIDDPPPEFVVSFKEEFAAACMDIPESDDPLVS